MASSSEQQAQQQQRQAEGEAGAGAGKGRGPRYRDLFKYAGWYDKLLILVGTLGAAGEGVAIPIIGGVMNKLVDSFGSEQDNPAKLAHEVSKVRLRDFQGAPTRASMACVKSLCVL